MNIKKKIGLFLFGVVIFCWIAAPILPFFDFPYKVIIITSILITGEVLFVLTIALLGKEYYQKIKEKLLQLFKKEKTEE